MPKNFITNSDTKELKRRLNQLIKSSKELKFLVGFFYFSGIRELYESLKANPSATLNVLVGLNVDHANYGLMECANNENLTNEEINHEFFESLRRSLNTEDFDTQEFYDQVKFFVKMIKEDKLKIRKTIKPNHSKLYIFKLDESQVKSKLFITGSSNLTKAGLSTQNEFNVEIGDYGSDEAEAYFDALWEDSSTKITELPEIKAKLIKVIEEKTLVRDVTPFEAFCLILKTYLGTFEEKELTKSLEVILEQNGYKKYNYQLDAIKQGLAIIEKNNGVIIADVVGLGKTIIACAIGNQLNKRGLIICPPGLIGDKNKESGWLKYLEEFKLADWEVRSSGDLENTAKALENMDDIEVVVVDEAHRFRNEDTESYELLRNICRGRQVILLTATPFNNKPGDILALLKLFVSTKRSTITLEANLAGRFAEFATVFDKLAYIKKNYNSRELEKRKKAIDYYIALFGENKIDLKKVAKRSKHLATQIRTVIEPVTIRRNRIDLQKDRRYLEEVKDLSRVADPIEWYFELSKEQSAFYDTVIDNYFLYPEEGGRFKGAIYRPFEYEKEKKAKLSEEDNRQLQQQRNLYDFMRRMVVKRFESSFGAFEQTIRNFKTITTTCNDFIKKTGQYILDRKLLEKIFIMEDGDEIEKAFAEYEARIKKGEYPKSHKRYKIKEFKRGKEFLSDIEGDLVLFDEILKKLDSLKLTKNDPKTGDILTNVTIALENEPNRKIVIFSEYVDTIKYLEPSFEKVFKDKLLVVAGELSQAKIRQINHNYDASAKKQDDDFDILLTSDKISEGFNLNRAGMVINYDIPWNPVRVIQRLGRINRISKKIFDELFIVNFFPTEKGAELVQSRTIAQNKMFMIHTALGEDSKIFDIDEEPSASGLYAKISKNPEESEPESFDTFARNLYEELKASHPLVIKGLDDMPPRVKVAKKADENKLFLFFKKERLYVSAAPTNEKKVEPVHLSFEEVFENIRCNADEAGFEWNTDNFWRVYEEMQKERELPTGKAREISLEQKALNNLSTLINMDNSSLVPFKNFLRTLKEDIVNWGTLPEYTLRRIIGFEETTLEEIAKLKNELGEDYLLKEKRRQRSVKRELIIAVENKKS
ncbi:MAG TPA: helicase-related protein [Acidobacteriota bacterium]|nr:helicase-related protein [Acidobacteriota bacterium]HNT17829.1 helicase-related protein [Acidobacteriota bacterium]